ncbi:hypothetical protein BDFB_010120 [Asbolus verrucosus]|uniref:Uncharacterized protein n=1 Tax=Asbolus verrucosus TaxID=1661398 RepID=A0A482VIQ4_ASBVE|nr:hypothetical protein BDFB_010120 [Asbolus verrucosus]
MFPQQYGAMQTGMNQSYGNYAANPTSMMQNNMQTSQQMMQGAQPNMFGGQQQSFGQPRPPQPDYRGMPQNPRSQYLQQAPNVTMNTMGGMAGQGGPAPPYSRQTPQGMQPGVQTQQNQFQQQRMRQQMLAMQQQQQQQGGPQGTQPSPALVAHLQRQMNPNPYQHQPPPYNM